MLSVCLSVCHVPLVRSFPLTRYLKLIGSVTREIQRTSVTIITDETDHNDETTQLLFLLFTIIRSDFSSMHIHEKW